MIEQLTAGVDWLTLTLPWGAPEESAWFQRGLVELMRIQGEGYDLVERALLGYRGHSCGNCFCGERDDGRMMQFSGRFAEQAFDYVYRTDAHISRLDVQVTIKHDVMPLNVAGRSYHDALNQGSELRSGQKRKCYLITGSDGGQTLYVGSMSSDQRGRLYNKEVQSESPEYVRTWRYEVVLRNERAQGLGDRLLAQTEGRPDFLSAFVAMWWQSRGVYTPWSFDETIAPLSPQKTLPTDVERQMSWIGVQVAPTVKRLIAAGYRDTLLVRLGFSTEAHTSDE
jgi:hypothetical protein